MIGVRIGRQHHVIRLYDERVNICCSRTWHLLTIDTITLMCAGRQAASPRYIEYPSQRVQALDVTDNLEKLHQTAVVISGFDRSALVTAWTKVQHAGAIESKHQPHKYCLSLLYPKLIAKALQQCADGSLAGLVHGERSRSHQKTCT